jgi:hypothetical protein
VILDYLTTATRIPRPISEEGSVAPPPAWLAHGPPTVANDPRSSRPSVNTARTSSASFWYASPNVLTLAWVGVGFNDHEPAGWWLELRLSFWQKPQATSADVTHDPDPPTPRPHPA